MRDDELGVYRIDSAPSVRVKRIEARKRIERNAHALVVQTTDGRGRVPMVIRKLFPDWYYDLRRGRTSIYGSLLRFIDVSIAPGTHLDLRQPAPLHRREHSRASAEVGAQDDPAVDQ